MYVIGIKKGMQLSGNKLNIQKTIYISTTDLGKIIYSNANKTKSNKYFFNNHIFTFTLNHTQFWRQGFLPKLDWNLLCRQYWT